MAVGMYDGCAYVRLKAFWKASFDFENAEVAVDRRGFGFTFSRGVDEWNVRRMADGLENCLNICCEAPRGLLARNDMFGDRNSDGWMDEKEDELKVVAGNYELSSIEVAASVQSMTSTGRF